MPDKWEYPWFAAWDLAFHMLPFARSDAAFAKEQLTLLLREWYMHPNGQIPAYEFALGDVNPPVHAWAAWRVYKMSGRRGERDVQFLARVFQKLLLNFTWWVNRKEPFPSASRSSIRRSCTTKKPSRWLTAPVELKNASARFTFSREAATSAPRVVWDSFKRIRSPHEPVRAGFVQRVRGCARMPRPSANTRRAGRLGDGREHAQHGRRVARHET